MSSLYELTQDFLTLMRLAEDPEVDEQTIKDTMESLDYELEEKADAYARIIRNLEADITAYKNEIDRFKTKKESAEKAIKRMKENLQESMEATGKTKFKTELFSFNVANNAPSVVIDAEDVNRIPVEFLKVKDPEVDKTALKAAMVESGVNEIPGICHLEQGRSLRIK